MTFQSSCWMISNVYYTYYQNLKSSLFRLFACLVSLYGNWCWSVSWGCNWNWRCDWNGGRDCGWNMGNSWNMSNSVNVRDCVLNKWGSWNHNWLVTSWARNGNLTKGWRDDWREDGRCDQAAWLVPVCAAETGLRDVAVRARNGLNISNVGWGCDWWRCQGSGQVSSLRNAH